MPPCVCVLFINQKRFFFSDSQQNFDKSHKKPKCHARVAPRAAQTSLQTCRAFWRWEKSFQRTRGGSLLFSSHADASSRQISAAGFQLGAWRDGEKKKKQLEEGEVTAEGELLRPRWSFPKILNQLNRFQRQPTAVFPPLKPPPSKTSTPLK